MEVTIIGAGNMGRGIGTRLVAGGNRVKIIDNDPEELSKRLPQDAKVVKAFNTTFAGTLVEGQVAGQPLDVFIAGEDENAKQTVAELARAGGLNPIDAGPLRRARELERIGFLHMTLQDGLGTGYGSAIKVIS